MGLVRIAERLDKKNDARRYALYLQAAEMGLPIALHRVGKAHYLGDLGQTEDKSLAISWLQRAARAGESEASVILGQHYDRPETEDEALAHEWRLLGAQQGSVFCMRVIGFHYLMDGEFGSDKEKAYYWLDRAAVRARHEGSRLARLGARGRPERPREAALRAAPMA
jgi:TPR repeat protein